MSFETVDALSLFSIKSCVESMSKSQLLSCFKQISKSSLQRVLVAILAPHCAVPSNKLLDPNEVTSCRLLLKQKQHSNHSNAVPTSNGPNHRNPFASLPRTIGGYILSYSHMKERLQHTLISRDFYFFSKDPIARYHFVVDEKFALALYHDRVQLHWFYNAQYLEVKYVFKDGKREQFEDKYYASIAQIIRKSPLLRTLKYDLTLRSFRTSFYAKQKTYYAYDGNCLEWMHNISERSNNDVFHSIHTLVLDPLSLFYYDTSAYRDSSQLLQRLLPNLSTYKLTSRRYEEGRGLQAHMENDAEWSVFKSDFYHRNLKHVDCDMVANIPQEYLWRSVHVEYPAHALRNLHRLRNLQTLKLKLMLFNGCDAYYQRIVDQSHHASPSPLALTKVSMEFGRRRAREVIEVRDYDPHSVIDSVCSMIMRCSPNVTRYTLITNCQENLALRSSANVDTTKMDHLLGFYDRLESLETDTKLIFTSGTRMLSLRRLVFRVASYTYSPQSLRMLTNDLKPFPHLREFKVIVKPEDWYEFNLNANVKTVMQYVLQQLHNHELKHIRIDHSFELLWPNSSNKPADVYKCSLFKSINRTERGGGLSSDICKLLVSLSCSTQFALESVAFHPITLRQRDMEYLYFWFNTRILAQNTLQRRNEFITDLVCLTE